MHTSPHTPTPRELRSSDARNKKNGQPKLSVKVGNHIEISNRFIRDYVAVFQIAKQCKAKPCHKPSLSKEGLGGL